MWLRLGLVDNKSYRLVGIVVAALIGIVDFGISELVVAVSDMFAADANWNGNKV